VKGILKRMAILKVQKTTFPPIIILIIGIISISTASLMIRYAQVHVSSIVIAFYRLGTAVLVLGPIAMMRYRNEISGIPKNQWMILIFTGLLLALHFAAWITSLENTTIASSVVLTTTVPLWVSIFSPLFLHERINKYVYWGMLIARIGGVTIGIANLPGTANTNIFATPSQIYSGKQAAGNFLAIVGAWMSAGYLMIGRKIRPRISLIPYTFIVYGASAFFLFVYIIFSKQKLAGFPPDIYIWLIGLGLIPQLLGHSSFNWALKYISATYVSIALLGEPIGATILGMIFIHEIPTGLEVLGGILILSGIYIASRLEVT
jgi:drug/metabolite transporter (DMT)-like permease